MVTENRASQKVNTLKPVTAKTHPLHLYQKILSAAINTMGANTIGNTDELNQAHSRSYGSLSDGHTMTFEHGAIIAELMAVSLDDDQSEWLKVDPRLYLDERGLTQFGDKPDCFYVLSVRITEYDNAQAHGADHGSDLDYAYHQADSVTEYLFHGYETARKVWGGIAHCYDIDGV